MGQYINLRGSIVVELPVGVDISGISADTISINEYLLSAKKSLPFYILESDAAVDVEFGPVSEASFVFIKVTGDEVTVKLTSAKGVEQVFGITGSFHIFCSSSPITAIELTRTPSQDTTVQLLLAQKA